MLYRWRKPIRNPGIEECKIEVIRKEPMEWGNSPKMGDSVGHTQELGKVMYPKWPCELGRS